MFKIIMLFDICKIHMIFIIIDQSFAGNSLDLISQSPAPNKDVIVVMNTTIFFRKI